MAERQQHKSARYRPQVVKRRKRSYFGPLSTSSSSIESRHSAAAPENRKPYEHPDDDGNDGPLLPAHAHHLILDRLPVRQRCQMGHLCKAWNNFVQSTSEEIWFVMVRPPKYGPSHRRETDRRPKYGHLEWRFRAYSSCSLHSNMKEVKSEVGHPFFHPPLPNPHHSTLSTILGGRNCSRVARRSEHMDGKSPFFLDLLLASAGGLMTAIVRMLGAETSHDVIVFNCLTGSVKVLPPPIYPEMLSTQRFLSLFLCMTLDWKDPGCYYILLNASFSPCYFQFYESRSHRWKAVHNPHVPFKSGKLLRNFVLTHPSSDELSVVDADFWWLQSTFHNRDHCLLAYHVRQDAWTSLLVPRIPCGVLIIMLPTSVVRFRGRLRVGALLMGLDRVILGFGVWELQLATSTWVEVARTPKHLLGPPLDAGMGYWNLSASGDLFWMTLCGFGTKRSFRPPLVFDMSRNAWYSLPLERTTRKFGCILLCRPSFRASV